mmetsp:Transcript_28575/g.67670  ORF Transcript_28575/g.67670 Transcript_28575/m.67670 type:complete len:289 (-) Transcript_28575:2213-3079(-)
MAARCPPRSRQCASAPAHVANLLGESTRHSPESSTKLPPSSMHVYSLLTTVAPCPVHPLGSIWWAPPPAQASASKEGFLSGTRASPCLQGSHSPQVPPQSTPCSTLFCMPSVHEGHTDAACSTSQPPTVRPGYTSSSWCRPPTHSYPTVPAGTGPAPIPYPTQGWPEPAHAETLRAMSVPWSTYKRSIHRRMCPGRPQSRSTVTMCGAPSAGTQSVVRYETLAATTLCWISSVALPARTCSLLSRIPAHSPALPSPTSKSTWSGTRPWCMRGNEAVLTSVTAPPHTHE